MSTAYTLDVTADMTDIGRARPARTRAGVGTIAVHIGVWLSLAAVVYFSVVYGWQLRKWMWEITDPIRFGDILRGYGWGYEAAKGGYVNLYEKMSVQQPNGATGSTTPRSGWAR
jgi:hypothetical protein